MFHLTKNQSYFCYCNTWQDPVKESPLLKHFLHEEIANNTTGATVLCDMLVSKQFACIASYSWQTQSPEELAPNNNLIQPTAEVPECWRREQGIFCDQWTLRSMSSNAFHALASSGMPNFRQWMDQIAGLPNSDGKDYICLNYIRTANVECEQYFSQWDTYANPPACHEPCCFLPICLNYWPHWCTYRHRIISRDQYHSYWRAHVALYYRLWPSLKAIVIIGKMSGGGGGNLPIVRVHYHRLFCTVMVIAN